MGNHQMPEDVVKSAQALFPNKQEREEVMQLLDSLLEQKISVGPDQLARSVLFLSHGKIEIVREIFSTTFYGDPRDMVLSAAIKNGYRDNYFSNPPGKNVK